MAKAKKEGQAALEAKLAEKAKLADPVPGDNGDALKRLVDYFAEKYPQEWESIRLCPAQHAVQEMVRLLNG